ncbi:hypothetical protein [Thermoanaerobacterium sp. DL9XJH110]|uniref:hypothetical protein n=1 Tax=Thermoanaerobacterium sp. DL9XJH110 TaxID=3386643 RepID=UPI003BB785BF
MEKQIPSIFSKIKGRIINLQSLNVQKINDKKPRLKEEIKLEIKPTTNYVIENINDTEVIINVSHELKFEPQLLFIINFNMDIRYKFKEPIDETEIKNNINELVAPCGPYISLITSFLSEKIIGEPFIIPPTISVT